jgi:hypothetical protein
VYDSQASSFHFDTYNSTVESFDRMFGYLADENNYMTNISAPIFIGEFTTSN